MYRLWPPWADVARPAGTIRYRTALHRNTTHSSENGFSTYPLHITNFVLIDPSSIGCLFLFLRRSERQFQLFLITDPFASTLPSQVILKITNHSEGIRPISSNNCGVSFGAGWFHSLPDFYFTGLNMSLGIVENSVQRFPTFVTQILQIGRSNLIPIVAQLIASWNIQGRAGTDGEMSATSVRLLKRQLRKEIQQSLTSLTDVEITEQCNPHKKYPFNARSKPLCDDFMQPPRIHSQ